MFNTGDNQSALAFLKENANKGEVESPQDSNVRRALSSAAKLEDEDSGNPSTVIHYTVIFSSDKSKVTVTSLEVRKGEE